MNSEINKSLTDIWLRSLGFYSPEMDMLKGRLKEISGKNIATNDLIVAEQDENRQVVKPENISITEYIIHKDSVAAGGAAW